MTVVAFKGFGGVRLEAEVAGDEHDPTILLIHGAGQTREVWSAVAESLVRAGRYVVSLDLRGHGGSEWPADGRYDLDLFVAVGTVVVVMEFVDEHISECGIGKRERKANAQRPAWHRRH